MPCEERLYSAAVQGETVQYQEIEGIQYKEWVCSTMRVTSAACREGVQFEERAYSTRRGVQY